MTTSVLGIIRPQPPLLRRRDQFRRHLDPVTPTVVSFLLVTISLVLIAIPVVASTVQPAFVTINRRGPQIFVRNNNDEVARIHSRHWQRHFIKIPTVLLSENMAKPTNSMDDAITAAAAAAAATTTLSALHEDSRVFETLRDWSSLDPESLSPTKCLIEQTLCLPSSDDDETQPPQLAKDYDYANSILEAWKEQEEKVAATKNSMWNTEWKSIKYYAHENNGTIPLYGHLVRRKRSKIPKNSNAIHEEEKVINTIPMGILLFHTGAGPHDIFLLWKASALVNTLFDDANNNNIVVLIADILSDESGWGWSDDRSRYNHVLDQIIRTSTTITGSTIIRPRLQNRIQAAVNTIQSELRMSLPSSTDQLPLAALGWCLGGYSILELSKMKIPGMMGMVSFHGVFTTDSDDRIDSVVADDVNQNTNSNKNESHNCEAESASLPKTEVLICHGCNDIFVSDQSIEIALATFQRNRNIVSLLQLQNAKHGFTNPAQDYNKGNPDAFGYNLESAEKAWRQAMALLRRKLLPPKR